MEEKNTYKYVILVGGKIVDKGITYDLHRRACEEAVAYPNGVIKQIGEKTTWEAAQKWQKRAAKK